MNSSLHIYPGTRVQVKKKSQKSEAEKLALCILLFTGAMFFITLVSLMLVLIVLTK